MVNTENLSDDAEVISVKSGPYKLEIAAMQTSKGLYELIDVTVSNTRPALLPAGMFINEADIPVFFEVASIEQMKTEVNKLVSKL